MISNSVLCAQAPKSLYVAKRITEAPDIDGFIGEEVWDMAEIDSVAIQYAPYNKNEPPKEPFSEFYTMTKPFMLLLSFTIIPIQY
jgi:hypothetical protein